MSIIAPEDLVSEPIWMSRDGSVQHCAYHTDTQDGHPVVNEHTKFPTVLEMVRAAYGKTPDPETEVWYTVYMGEYPPTPEPKLPAKAYGADFDPEDEDGDKPISWYAKFKEMQDAYEYALTIFLEVK